MSGLIRVIWTINGQPVKDETVPHDLNSLEQIGDGAKINGAALNVSFEFDPPLVAPRAEA